MKKILVTMFLMCALALGGRSLWPTSLIENEEPIDLISVSALGKQTQLDLGSPMLVNADHPLPNEYKPGSLVNLYEQKGRAFQLAKSDILLDKQVFAAMNRMFIQAEHDGVNGFIITSGYRSAKRQQQIYDESPAGLAALPGASEHQTGLAFDVTAYSGGQFEQSRQFDWLNEHCWEFGFIMRYPEGKQHITGIAYEPWHYRYVGIEASQAIKDSGQTLEEYLEAY